LLPSHFGIRSCPAITRKNPGYHDFPPHISI
jgi:hypothetical protein